MAISRSFVLRRQGLRLEEVSKVQQGCLARGETEAVEVDLDMSMALSRPSWLIGMDPAKVQQDCLARKTGHADLGKIVYIK
jgi:hypothetical protein